MVSAGSAFATGDLHTGEWRHLSKLAVEVDPSLHGALRNFLVRPFGNAVSTPTGLLSRAFVLQADGFTQGGKVLLKLRHSDWLALEDSTGVFKVLQSQVSSSAEDCMLDCTHDHTTVICTAALEAESSICMAEVFSGGFSGWSQAAYILHRGGTPIHTSWTLDVDPECEDMLRFQSPGLHCVWRGSDLDDLLDDTPASVHVCANIQSDWWLRIFAIRPVHITAISPPCQPWSEAGQGAGLASDDGQLMLRAIDVLGAIQVPVVVLEQVGGFLRHPHAKAVFEAWALVGYEILWQATVDLLDVLPSSRPRTLIVFRHKSCRGPPALTGHHWACTKRHNLATAQVLFDLPDSLLQPLILSEELVSTYMDPWFMPPSRVGQVSQSRVEAFRIRTAATTAGCFMAQYQFQHELPQNQLSSRGLLGFLLRHQGVLRFFSGAEVAALHGAVRPMLLQEDRRCQMRLLGNSLAVPQAAAGLAYACHALGFQGTPAPAEAVASCLSARMHNANAFFLPRGPDWILCRKDRVYELLVSGALKPLPSISQTAPQDFVPLTFQASRTAWTVYVPAGAPALRVFSHLGVAHLAPALPATAYDRIHALRLSVESPPSLDCAGFAGGCANTAGLCTVLVTNGVFIIDTWSPRMWTQLLNVFDFLTPDAEDLCCWTPSGQRLRFADDFEGCVVANTSPSEAPHLPLSILAASVPFIQTSFQNQALQLACPAAWAVDFWLGFPFHLALAYGWDAQVDNFPPAPEASVTICLQPVSARVHLSPPALPRQLRIWFLVAGFEAASVPENAEDAMPVEVQIEAQRIWWGHFSDLLRIASLEAWWRAASGTCNLPPDARVFSGPHPVSAEETLLAIKSRRQQRIVRKNGRLLLTVQPAIVGGGVKDEQKHWAQTRAASVCLTQGLDLRTTTAFIDEVSSAGTTARLSQAIKATSDETKWAQLASYAKDLGVTVPQTTSMFQRADQRAKRQLQKRRAQHADQLKASAVQVQAGFFVNEDGSHAQILEGIRPGATGLLLVDGDQAADALATLQGVQPDELGILVLGHTCPEPSSCSCRISFPATGRACGSQLLLAGCLHNVGGKALRTSQRADITVTLPDILCCTFTAFADEFSAGQWEQIIQAPVKQLLSIFQDVPAAKAITAPWGRQYRCKGKIASPSASDQVHFQARVPKDEADSLLIASGHNSVYITPRLLDHSLLPGYSIIWIGGQRQEAIKASLQIPEQRGLVRSKDRFGLRVPETRYEAAFGLVRPGQTAPARVSVQYLFRVGPVPSGADAASVSTWASKFNWTVKVIRASGPCHWLVGAAEKPPSAWPLFNGQTVLIHAVQQREARQSVVQSGSLNLRMQAEPVASTKDAKTAEDPWLFSDPWSHSRFSMSSQGSRDSGSRPAAAAQTPQPRAVTGPTEQRFQQQDARIQALEDGIQALKAQHEQNHAQLVQQQNADRQTAAQATAGLQEQLSTVGSELTRQLQASAEALQTAQSQQQLQMQSSLDELKSLFLESREHRAAAKKHKPDKEDDL